MRPGERETDQAVIKAGRLPCVRVVAGLASLRQMQADMAGVRGLLEVRQVAACAIRGCTFEFVANVAGRTVQRGMHSGEREAGVLQMIEGHPKPVVHLVALITGRRKTCRHMTRTGCPLIVLGMAGIALRRHGAEVTERAILVAGVTIQCGVRTHQRKTVQVLLDLLDGDLPAPHGVTLLTTGPELPPVNVGVTVGTFCAHVTEYRFGMALGASHPQMHATQRVTGLIVVEFRHTADGLPPADRVAVLAGDIETTMRAASIGVRLRLRECRNRTEEKCNTCN